jgi:uncharacterized membrane protein
MLIVFPLGLFTVAAIFDIIYISTHNGHLADLSYWMIASGIIGGLIAAVFGLIDWLGIPESTRAKYIGLIHGSARHDGDDARMDRHRHSTLCRLVRR